eukprot:g12327.t1
MPSNSDRRRLCDAKDLESGLSPTSQAPTIPGEVNASMSMTSEFREFPAEPQERGVWYSGYSMAGPPALGNSLLIVCFGDAKRGQLGVEPVTGARQPETRTRTPQVNS